MGSAHFNYGAHRNSYTHRRLSFLHVTKLYIFPLKNGFVSF
jgi:hypothetical protein